MNAQLSTIQFYGHPLITIEQDGKYYVALRPICDNIGLAWGAQYNRIKRDDVLNSVIFIMKTTGNDNKEYQMLCLPIEYLNGWLFGIDIKRVRPEIRDTLIRYKKECYQVLHDYWHKTGGDINQDKVKRCYELANTVASKVAQDTFNKLMCSDEETIAGRWWVATGWRNGEPIATSGLIPRNAHIATLEELADRIERGDGFIATKPEEFAKLAHACMNAIARRINYLTTK